VVGRLDITAYPAGNSLKRQRACSGFSCYGFATVQQRGHPTTTRWVVDMPADRSVNAESAVVMSRKGPDVPADKSNRGGACRAGLRGRSASTATTGADDAVARASPTVVPVLAAVWCSSVGTTWTVELHQLDRGAAWGTTVDWISSGVPTSLPSPAEGMAHQLLAGRGLALYPDPTAGPCTHSRYSIGYVCADARVITLAHRLREVAATTGTHPITLALQQLAAGFSAAGWGG
jgi:hypothetical protein